MSKIEQLGAQLTAELETFLEALRNRDDIKKWLDDPRFSSLYGSHETSARESFAAAIARYELKAIEAEQEEEDFRNAIVITTKETLKHYLASFKQVMQRSADTMIHAFVATATK